jgi:divalent metal cation (Fe/Co/Zn/Cd) transporter
MYDQVPREALESAASLNSMGFNMARSLGPATGGLLVAMLGVFLTEALNMPVIDGIASVLVGAILAITATFLAIKSQSLLTGEAASHEVRVSINKIVRGESGLTGLNQARTMHFGPNEVFVAVSLDFQDDLPAGEVEATVTRLERAIKAAHPEVRVVFIEAQSFDADRRAGRS